MPQVDLEKRNDPFAGAKPPTSDLSHLYRGPARPPMPSAVELGARLRTMREDQGLILAEAARRAGLDEDTLTTFEESGKASAQDMLDLIGALSHSTSFHDAFRLPRFTEIAQVIEHAKRTRP